MAPRIIKETASGKIDVKCMYLPGVIVEDDCPKCGKTWTFNGDDSYISYPVIGDKVNLYGYCDACGTDWDVHVQLNVGIGIAL